MTGDDIIMMRQKDLRRLHVIRKAIDRIITQKKAAEIIGIGLRQAQRVVRQVRIEGDKGIIHKSRGTPSNRAKPDKVKNKALKLFKSKYPDFGPTLASEKLFERDKIKVNDETLRLWLIDAGLPYRKRKKRPHRQWRERKKHYGQMVQMDGSEHKWFEDRGPKCVLMGYIDDATGIPFGRFHAYEGTIPAMDSFKRYIKKRGIPLSIYLDKHATYKSTKKQTVEEELANQESLSQFERALKELGVEVIHANSPQAKGRVERIFNTFQDRLIKEMRLAHINTIDQANAFLEKYLPVYAKRFAVKPAKTGDLHHLISKGTDLDRILCVKTKRQLRNDFTVAHDRKLYQILDNVRAKRVMVEEYIDGSMAIWYKAIKLKFKEITTRPEKQAPEKKHIFGLIRTYVPEMRHPWRQYKDRYTQMHSYSQKEKVAQKEKRLLLRK